MFSGFGIMYQEKSGNPAHKDLKIKATSDLTLAIKRNAFDILAERVHSEYTLIT
jgi:hypothetical protein